MPAEETTTAAETAPIVEETAAGQSTAGDTTTTDAKPEPSLEDRIAAQTKVNRDLERKLTEARKAADRLASVEAELAKLQGKEAEYAETQKARETEAAALAKANERILKAEIRAAAAGKLNDPADALLYIDLTKFEVGEDGEVDTAAVTAAIEDLAKNKPYLAAQGGRRFQGDADGGARKDTGPTQLTQADLDRMYAAGQVDEIAQAKREHRFDQVLGIKP